MDGATGIVADIGATNARFATAMLGANGEILLGEQATLRTGAFPSFEAAFEHYSSGVSRRFVKGVFALASPIGGDEIKLTNSPWVLRPAGLAERIGLGRVRLINDFEAIARAVARLPASGLRPLTKTPLPLPDEGMISIIGPGSGLGVGQLLRREGHEHVIACEGGHIGFAPADEVDARILALVSRRYSRVSAERLISGPGLAQIYGALAELEGRAMIPPDPVSLWQAALDNDDVNACAAVQRWLMLLGTFAGDIALAQGASAVVLGGGILPRFDAAADMTPFLSRYFAKGRFEPMMRRIPVALITYPEPGLFGAASLLLGREDSPRAVAPVT